jgi:hypothetical protein
MARGGGKGPKGQQKVEKAGVKREEGFLYFIDKQGNVAKVKMARSSGRRSARTAAKRAPKRRTAARKTAKRGAAARRAPKRRATAGRTRARRARR